MTVLRYGAEVPEGFQTCNAMRGRDVQVNHLVRWVNHGTPGRTVLCGLTRFDSAPGARDADLPGWLMGGGLFGPGIRQEACAACWEAAKRTPNEGDAKGWESSHSSPGRGQVLASGDGSEGRSLLPDHDGKGEGPLAAERPRAIVTEHETAATTGLWAVLLYETKDYLLAAHGPYSSADHAREWATCSATQIDKSRGGRVDIVPLWRPEDVGKS